MILFTDETSGVSNFNVDDAGWGVKERKEEWRK